MFSNAIGQGRSSDPVVIHYNTPDPLSIAGSRLPDDLIVSIRSTSPKLYRYYTKQNATIDRFLQPLDLPIDDQVAGRRRRAVLWAVRGSLLANVILVVLQFIAAFQSGALSLFATLADSFMDNLSGMVLVYTTYAASRINYQAYPAGRRRIETVGVIVFSALMATLAVQLIIESVKRLLARAEPPNVTTLSIVLVCVALAVKLLLFLYCVRFKDAPSAMVLAQDHRNDLFVNSLGLTTAILGSRLLWWIDPVGAIVVALIILRSWLITAYEQIQLIIGKSADTDTINHITYIAMTHDPLIEQLDTVRAYHAGTHLYVEVDVVMSPETRLIESHDAAEALQNKLEQMPAIDRAFVHVDHEFLHTPEHRNAFT